MLLQPCLQRLSTTQSVSSAIRPHSSREHAHSSRQRQLACRAFGSEELAQDPQNTAPRPAEMEHEVPALSVREVEELIAAAEEELDFEIEAPQQYRRSEDSSALGFLEDELYQQKAAHRQLGKVLCRRCRSLSHGNMIPGVQSFGRPPDDSEKHLLTPDQLRAQLTCVRSSKAVVVLLVDLLDASGSFFSNVRQLVGANPIVIVGTKFDLLPKGCKVPDMVDWLQGLAVRKKVNSISTHVVSSRSKLGLAEAAKAILVERRGRDVYCMGAANVGKSAFIRALVAEMSTMASSSFDPAAVAHSRHLPMESAMPGTTLQLIPLSTFSGNGALYDTPGLHFHHRLMHMLPPDDVKRMHPRKPLAPYTAPSPLSLAWQTALPASSRRTNSAAGSYLWGAVLRLDVLHAPAATSLTFYGPPVLSVRAVPLLPAEAHAQLPVDPNEASGAADQASFGASTVDQRGGLVEARMVDISVSGQPGPLLDIAVSGLTGWVTVSAPRATGRMSLRVWAPRGCEVFVRPALPVSDAAPLMRTDRLQPARSLSRQKAEPAVGRSAVAADWWNDGPERRQPQPAPARRQAEVDYTDPAVWAARPGREQ